MAFHLPTFNLTCNLWTAGNPVANPPDVVVLGNLTPYRQGLWAVSSAVATINVPSNYESPTQLTQLLLPPATDIRGYDTVAPAVPTLVECPAGTGRYYIVYWVEDVGKGFTNEHRLALMQQATAPLLLAFGNPWAAPGWPWPMP